MPDHDPVRWADLHVEQFLDRQAACPVVYLPLGLCEPHGHVAPFGLDTIKADFLCDEAARRFGGIVAPTMGYHIHETGYHAPWLREVMGRVNPRLGAIPPHVLLECFLYQLRSFANAGFQAVVAISGHHGGNQEDLRRVARAFAAEHAIQFFVASDPELVEGLFAGDHAGRYELSQLLHIRPDLVKLDRADRVGTTTLGRFAPNPDVLEASATEGRAIIDACLQAIGDAVHRFELISARDPGDLIPMSAMEPIWTRVLATNGDWLTLDHGRRAAPSRT